MSKPCLIIPDDYLNVIKRLESELAITKEEISECKALMVEQAFQKERMREALEAVAKPPYHDSDPKSLLETLRAIAQSALDGGKA